MNEKLFHVPADGRTDAERREWLLRQLKKAPEQQDEFIKRRRKSGRNRGPKPSHANQTK